MGWFNKGETRNKVFEEVLSDLKSHVELSLLALEPIITDFYSTKATRITKRSFSVLMETLMYLLSAGSLASIFFLGKIAPFYVIAEIRNKQEIIRALGQSEIDSFVLGIRILFVVVALLFFVIGYLFRHYRLYKNTVYQAAYELKQIKEHLGSSIMDLELMETNYKEILEPPTDSTIL